MAADYRSWSGPARAMALTVDAAVAAAQAGDAARFATAVAELNRLDADQVGLLVGAMTRDLVERTHSAGLDSDAAQILVLGCHRSAAPWYPRVNSDVVVLALAGALGIHDVLEMSDPHGLAAVDAAALALHGLLLIVELLRSAGEPITEVLEAALHELMRAQTVELP